MMLVGFAVVAELDSPSTRSPLNSWDRHQLVEQEKNDDTNHVTGVFIRRPKNCCHFEHTLHQRGTGKMEKHLTTLDVQNPVNNNGINY